MAAFVELEFTHRIGCKCRPQGSGTAVIGGHSRIRERELGIHINRASANASVAGSMQGSEFTRNTTELGVPGENQAADCDRS
jgi:hypothetical protein